MKPLTHIVFFANTKAQFGVLESFTEGLFRALTRQNVKCSMLDLVSEGPDVIQKKLQEFCPDCTIGFNMVLAPDVFFQELGIKHLAILVDNASYFSEIKDYHNCIGGCVEEDSCELLRYMGHKAVLYIPHAIDRDVVSTANSLRDLDLVVAASFYDADEVYENWKCIFSKSSLDTVCDIAERSLQSESLSHVRALLETLTQNEAFRIELSKKGISPVIIANSLDRYIRGRDRVRFLEAIDVCSVDLFCDESDHAKWRRVLPNKKNIRYHKAVSYTDLPALFSRAKCVLNSAPMIKHGFHERLFLALARGASVIGSQNVRIGSTFGRGFCGILSPEYAAANQFLEWACAHEKERYEAVQQTHKLIMSEHTWDARAAMLIERLPELLAGVG